MGINGPVPKPCIYELWEAFNDVAEGFGLSVHEFQEIIRVAIKDYSGRYGLALYIPTATSSLICRSHR